MMQSKSICPFLCTHSNVTFILSFALHQYSLFIKLLLLWSDGPKVERTSLTHREDLLRTACASLDGLKFYAYVPAPRIRFVNEGLLQVLAPLTSDAPISLISPYCSYPPLKPPIVAFQSKLHRPGFL